MNSNYLKIGKGVINEVGEALEKNNIKCKILYVS